MGDFRIEAEAVNSSKQQQQQQLFVLRRTSFSIEGLGAIMVDSKTDDNKDTVKDRHDGRVTNDITMIDTEVEKEELSYLEEEEDTHLGNKDSSPQFQATQVENKESILRDLKQDPVVATAQELHSEKGPHYPNVKLPKEGSSIKEQGLIDLSSVVISAGTVADPESNANTTKLLQGNSGKADGTHLDPLIQSDSILPSKMGGQELNNGLTGMEFDPDTATKEEELRNGETGSELLPENEIKDKESNNEMTKMEFLLGNEIKDGELNVGVTKMELPPDTETKEEELHNGVTGMELPPDNEIKEELNNAVTGMEVLSNNEIKEESPKKELDVGDAVDAKISNKSFLETNANGGDESGTEEEQAAFMKELETFHKERCLEFKPPRFYGEPLNCLKLWRAVIRLGGYEQVTSCKLWRQVGESFKPPNLTCTTVSWTFRCFYEKDCIIAWSDVRTSFTRILQNFWPTKPHCCYEKAGHAQKSTEGGVWVMTTSGKSHAGQTCPDLSWACHRLWALLEYEKHKMRSGELPFTDASFTEPTSAGNQPGVHQASGSGRARRDAAARAMQGWHSQRLLGNGEVGDPIIKDKNSTSTPKREKQLKSIGLLKRKKPSPVERAVKAARLKASKPQSDSMVVDIGPAADWVKINVQRTKDCFEIYALVPGLLREEGASSVGSSRALGYIWPTRASGQSLGCHSIQEGLYYASFERFILVQSQKSKKDLISPCNTGKVVSLPSRIDPHQTSAVVTLHGQLFVRVPFEQSDL
ncbi:unnamed protein product [Camellia sinensis]